jgi:hypothetical protein
MIDAAGEKLVSQQVSKCTHNVTILALWFVIASEFSVPQS